MRGSVSFWSFSCDIQLRFIQYRWVAYSFWIICCRRLFRIKLPFIVSQSRMRSLIDQLILLLTTLFDLEPIVLFNLKGRSLLRLFFFRRQSHFLWRQASLNNFLWCLGVHLHFNFYWAVVLLFRVLLFQKGTSSYIWIWVYLFFCFVLQDSDRAVFSAWPFCSHLFWPCVSSGNRWRCECIFHRKYICFRIFSFFLSFFAEFIGICGISWRLIWSTKEMHFCLINEQW